MKFINGSGHHQAASAPLALMYIGGIGLATMFTMVASVASLQGWKFRRWRAIEWDVVWTWQEIYMMFAMYLLATGLWVAALAI